MKKILTTLVPAVLFVLILLSSACSNIVTTTLTRTTIVTSNTSPATLSDETTRTVTDMAGRVVELPMEINRIGTIGPIGVLNTFVELMGEGSKIFNEMPGRFKSSGNWDMHYEFAPQILNAPLYEDGNGEILIETIIQTKPDVCFVMSVDTAQFLVRNGIACIYLEWKELSDIPVAVNLMGEVLNRQDMAELYLSYFDTKLALAQSLTASLNTEQRAAVLYGNPVTFSQPHIIAEWWITQAGGISVTNNGRSTESFTYTLEDILIWNPAVMIVSDAQQIIDVKADSRYAGITAVKNDAIYAIPTVAHVWGNRTVEQPLTILWTLHHIYPELMSYETLAQEIKYFYKTFFLYDLSDTQVAKIITGA